MKKKKENFSGRHLSVYLNGEGLLSKSTAAAELHNFPSTASANPSPRTSASDSSYNIL